MPTYRNTAPGYHDLGETFEADSAAEIVDRFTPLFREWAAGQSRLLLPPAGMPADEAERAWIDGRVDRLRRDFAAGLVAVVPNSPQQK